MIVEVYTQEIKAILSNTLTDEAVSQYPIWMGSERSAHSYKFKYNKKGGVQNYGKEKI